MMGRLAAELFGTLWLVLGGCGAAVLTALFPQVGIASIAGASHWVHAENPDGFLQAFDAFLDPLHGEH